MGDVAGVVKPDGVAQVDVGDLGQGGVEVGRGAVEVDGVDVAAAVLAAEGRLQRQ